MKERRVKDAYDYLGHHNVRVDTLIEVLGDLPGISEDNLKLILSKTSIKVQNKIVVVGAKLHQLVEDYVISDQAGKRLIRFELTNTLRKWYKMYRKLCMSTGLPHSNKSAWMNDYRNGYADLSIHRFIEALNE